MNFYYVPNTCALASHIALEEAGAAYTGVRLNFADEEQKKPEYLAINPKARVPALVTQEEAAPAPKSLEISGYATAAELAEEKTKGIMDTPVAIDHPIDGVLIERTDETIELARTGSGKDASWRLSKPMSAVAVKFQVETMVKLFKDDTLSVHSKAIEPEDLPLFDLEPERRIHIKLTAGGSVWGGVDLIVGKVQSSESEGAEGGIAKDTWVMRADDEGTVYRIAGKDLRVPFEIGLEKLRDKKVFDVKPEDLVHVEIASPAGESLVLDGERAEKTTTKPDGTEETKWEVEWSLTEPSGVPADDSVKSIARNIANARAQEFQAASEGPADEAWTKAWKVSARSHDGRELALEVTDEVDGKHWGRIPGSEEVIEFQTYAANNLRKTIADVKDKSFISFADTEVTRVRFSPEEGGPVVVEKRGETWHFLEGGAGLADLGTQLKTLVKAKAQRWARKDEMEAARGVLLAPEFSAEVSRGIQTLIVGVGPKMEDEPYKGQRWAAVASTAASAEMSSDPFLIQDYVAKRFRKAAKDLAWKKVFDLSKEDIQELKIVWPASVPDGGTVTLARDPASGDLVPADLPQGKKAKRSAITTMLSTLPTMKAKDFVLDKAPADVGLAPADAVALTITTQDGKSTQLLLASAAEEGADVHAQATSGPLAGQVITLNSYQAKNLRKKLADLVE